MPSDVLVVPYTLQMGFQKQSDAAAVQVPCFDYVEEAKAIQGEWQQTKLGSTFDAPPPANLQFGQ
jgi:hypothetical protein